MRQGVIKVRASCDKIVTIVALRREAYKKTSLATCSNAQGVARRNVLFLTIGRCLQDLERVRQKELEFAAQQAAAVKK